MYTKEETTLIVTQYLENPTRDTVNRLAKEINKPQRSVIGKLSKEGVYRREGYKTKRGDTPITKVQLVTMIADNTNTPADLLEGLEKAPKNVLLILLEKTAIPPVQIPLNP